MQIGCENHPFDYWLSLKREDIARLDGRDGLRFAKIWKKQLRKLINNR
jgi:hypothetical protein